MVKLDGVTPPLTDVAILGNNPLRVYVVLFEAAQADNRGNCGGTTSWTIKGLANEIGIERRTVSKALDKLLDSGYIQIAGEQRNKDSSNSTVWRVTHPEQLEAVRYSIEMMGPPSERLKKMRTKNKKADTTKYQETEWLQGL
jgi:DNA-binding transcriptional MocR family regulator